MKNLIKLLWENEMEIIIGWVFKISIFLIIVLIINWFYPKDDTDAKGFWKRSGLTLYTDNLTGCQYIKGGMFGNMIKRVDKNGNHICITDK